MKGKYREANSLAEFKSIILHGHSEECFLWQNHSGERAVFQVKELKLDEHDTELIIKLRDPFSDLAIHTTSDLYVKLEFRGAMFKTKIKKMNNTSLVAYIPKLESIQAVETRRELRTTFDLQTEKMVMLSLKHDDELNTESSLKFQVFDISQNGICVIVSGQNHKFVKNCSDIFITHLGNKKLNEPIRIIQRHMQKFRYKKLGKSFYSMRVGFELADSFLPDELNLFIQELV